MIKFLGGRTGASQRKHCLSLSLETLSSNVANNTELGGGHCRLRKGHVHKLSRTGGSLILLLGGKRWDLADLYVRATSLQIFVGILRNLYCILKTLRAGEQGMKGLELHFIKSTFIVLWKVNWNPNRLETEKPVAIQGKPLELHFIKVLNT